MLEIRVMFHPMDRGDASPNSYSPPTSFLPDRHKISSNQLHQWPTLHPNRIEKIEIQIQMQLPSILYLLLHQLQFLLHESHECHNRSKCMPCLILQQPIVRHHHEECHKTF